MILSHRRKTRHKIEVGLPNPNCSASPRWKKVQPSKPTAARPYAFPTQGVWRRVGWARVLPQNTIRFFFPSELRNKHNALRLLGKCSTTELKPQPLWIIRLALCVGGGGGGGRGQGKGEGGRGREGHRVRERQRHSSWHTKQTKDPEVTRMAKALVR